MERQIDKIAVVDFGGQYAHLISRRIRELGVYSEIVDSELDLIEFEKYKGIILSGGPSSVYEKNAPTINEKIFDLNIPVLGICYGHQLIAHILGGKVLEGKTKEYGLAELDIRKKSILFENINKRTKVWMSHGDSVYVLPPGFSTIAQTRDCKNAAISNEERRIFGLQFHPEVTHTKEGMKILKNFVYKICNCRKSWTMKNFLEKKIVEIKEKTKGKKVFMLVSGGVDSTVALKLIAKAIGNEKIYALHVDTGLMRKNESKEIIENFEKEGIKINFLDESERFTNALKEIYDPERKREIIGKLFVDIVNEHIKKMNLNAEEWLLGQGTIYPDTIETAATKKAAKIKTHHNRVESIKQMIEEGKVIEPIAELYKDEVRKLGKILGIKKEILERHPFPGPGLAVRIICSEKDKADDFTILEKEVNNISKKFGYAAKILPIKSVGVQGDSRSYKHAAVLIGKLDWNRLEKCSTKITNEIRGINRVIFALTEIKSLKLKKAYINKERISLLQDIDDEVNRLIKKANSYNKIWQMPVVLLPVCANDTDFESVVLRPIQSREAMTAEFFKMNTILIEKIKKVIIKNYKISAVFYDITHKPPATIEWE